jgi:hypothetical protein
MNNENDEIPIVPSQETDLTDKFIALCKTIKLYAITGWNKLKFLIHKKFNNNPKYSTSGGIGEW